MKSEFKVTIDRNPAVKHPNFAAAQEVDAGIGDQIKARKAELHAKAAKEDAALDVPAVAVETASGPRQSVESVELILPDGRYVLFGPPAGISLTMRIINLGGQQSSMKNTLLRVLMCVREIEGVKPEVVADDISATKLANILGDDAIDVLSAVYLENWPGVKKSELPRIKKNLRV